jgi:hypothetical protein
MYIFLLQIVKLQDIPFLQHIADLSGQLPECDFFDAKHCLFFVVSNVRNYRYVQIALVS